MEMVVAVSGYIQVSVNAKTVVSVSPNRMFTTVYRYLMLKTMIE